MLRTSFTVVWQCEYTPEPLKGLWEGMLQLRGWEDLLIRFPRNHLLNDYAEFMSFHILSSLKQGSPNGLPVASEAES